MTAFASPAVEAPKPAHTDAIGGIRCSRCGKPMLKLVMKDGTSLNLRAVLFKLCKCGHYNVVDLEKS